MNGIVINKGNSSNISIITPSGSSENYDIDFYVSLSEDGDEFLVVLSKTGITITDDVALIEIDVDDTIELDARVYFYQVDMVNETERLTILNDTFNVLPSIIK